MQSKQLLAILMALPALSSAGEIENMVAMINKDASATWTAAIPSGFNSFAQAKTLCGTYLRGHPQYKQSPLDFYDGPSDVSGLADSLDLRTAHPGCTIISKIRDQSACGSCWAFSSTESFQDRRCIITGQDVEYSALDTATNGNTDANGCKGGQPALAFKWMAKTGVVTGGDFPDVGKGTGCQPYPFAPCAHHLPPGSGTYPACNKTEARMSRVRECTDKSYGKSYKQDKSRGTKGFSIRPGKTAAAQALAALPNGTVSAGFTVYEDFLTYKSGVYKHVTGKTLGGHAVSIIGYGTDPTAGDYWLCKNSWNEKWGDNGTFKIARGTDEAQIETYLAFIEI